MRILFLSNFYPPARSGGYTQWCYEVAQGLAARGHTTGVLTSRYERNKAPEHESNIFRLLHLEGGLAYYQPLHFFTAWTRQHRENLLFLEERVNHFRPDLLFVWGMWALSHALPALAEELLPGRVVYYLSDYWPAAQNMHTAYWQAPPHHWPMSLPKRALRFVAGRVLARAKVRSPRFENALVVSHAVKQKLIQAGLPLEEARVVHGGTDTARFQQQGERRFSGLDGAIRLLYAGQLVEHKGVHTAIEAIARLAKDEAGSPVRLTIMGSGHPAYEARLRRMVAEQGLHDRVHFRAPAAATEVPAIFAAHDILVFPSIYDEPLARVTQEAMASGLAVVGTTTGGTSEILRDESNGLAFPAGDAEVLARQIGRLIVDPDLAARLAAAGRQRVFTYFNLERMIGEIESALFELADERAPHHERAQAAMVR